MCAGCGFADRRSLIAYSPIRYSLVAAAAVVIRRTVWVSPHPGLSARSVLEATQLWAGLRATWPTLSRGERVRLGFFPLGLRISPRLSSAGGESAPWAMARETTLSPRERVAAERTSRRTWRLRNGQRSGGVRGSPCGTRSAPEAFLGRASTTGKPAERPNCSFNPVKRNDEPFGFLSPKSSGLEGEGVEKKGDGHDRLAVSMT